jgi:UDP-glucose 4-epimerase
LAKKAKESGGVKHFIFMSSIKVYGEESDISYSESTICEPQDEYGKSKLEAEKQLLNLQNDNFKISIIRTPIVYGYGVKANIKNLINLVNNIPILPFANIENKRSMVYVGNLCYIIDKIILQEKEGLFLASDNKPLSTTTLIELIAKSLDKKVYLINIPFFESLLKFIKPSFHKRLFGSLKVDNAQTIRTLFSEAKASLPYSVEDGINYMLKGEK